MTSQTSQSNPSSISFIGQLIAGLAIAIISFAIGLAKNVSDQTVRFLIPGDSLPLQELTLQSTERKCFGWDTENNSRAWICDDGIAICDDTRVKLPTHILSTPVGDTHTPENPQ